MRFCFAMVALLTIMVADASAFGKCGGGRAARRGGGGGGGGAEFVQMQGCGGGSGFGFQPQYGFQQYGFQPQYGYVPQQYGFQQQQFGCANAVQAPVQAPYVEPRKKLDQ